MDSLETGRPTFSRKALGRPRRLSGSVVCNRLRRPGDFLDFIRLLQKNARAHCRQPSGRSKSLYWWPLKQVIGLQVFLKYYLKLSNCPRKHPRRDFLAANFDNRSLP